MSLPHSQAVEERDCHVDSVPAQVDVEACSLNTAGALLRPLDQRINRVETVFDTTPKVTLPAREALSEIQNGEYAKSVTKVRTYSLDARRDENHPQHKSYKKCKRSLPAYTYGGTFKKRTKEDLGKTSELLIGDIDGKDNDINNLHDAEACRDSLKDFPFVLAAWVSPSGDGVKFLVNIGNHPLDAMGYEQAAKDLAKAIPEWTIDEQCKDVCRLCFTSHDPGLWINEEAIPLPLSSDGEGECRHEQCERPYAAAHEDDIAEALSCIPPRPDYDDWIRIVSAVGAALPIDRAESLLSRWSPEESQGEYRKLLEKPLTEIKIGTLFFHAKKHGYRARKRSKDTPRNEADWARDYVYCAGDDTFVNIKKLNPIKPQAFNRLHSNDYRKIRTLTPDGEERVQQVAAVRYALEEAKIPTVDRIEFMPQHEGVIITTDNETRLLNTYREQDYKRKATETEIKQAEDLIRAHIEFFCREQHAGRLLHDYMAHTAQNPGKPKSWCVILIGVQGDGKSTINAILMVAVGSANTAMVTPKILKDMFTSISTESVFTRVEEVNLSEGKYDILGQLKADIGTGMSVHRGMHKESATKPVIASVIFTTNEEGALPISSGDRRFMVVESKWRDKDAAYKAGKEHFAALHQLLQEVPDAFRQALLRYPVSEEFIDAHQAPYTEAKDRFIQTAMSGFAHDLRDWIERAEGMYPEFVNNEVVCIKSLKAWYNTVKVTNDTLARYPGDKSMNSALRELGYTEQYNDTVSNEGRKNRVTIMHRLTLKQEDLREIAKKWLSKETGKQNGNNTLAKQCNRCTPHI